MNDFDHVVSSDLEYGEKPSPKVSKVLVVILSGLIITTGGSAALFFGIRNSSQDEILNPEPSPRLLQVFGEESVISIPSTSSPSASASPGLKISSTPSPAPTIKPSPTPTPKIISKIINSSSPLDGFRSSDGTGDVNTTIKIGRNGFSMTRGFVSFDIGSLPEDVTFEKATLRLFQTEIIGDPYAQGYKIKVDHINFGDNLNNEDYNITPISANLTSLTENSVIEWKDAIITDALKKDISEGRSTSQFRLHFDAENQGGGVTGDYAIFESNDNSEGTNNLPQLVILYY